MTTALETRDLHIFFFQGVTDLRPAGTAKCLGNFYTGAYWGDVRANDCIPPTEDPIDIFNQDIWGKTVQTDALSEIAEVRN